jgi:hypothetical protein
MVWIKSYLCYQISDEIRGQNQALNVAVPIELTVL